MHSSNRLALLFFLAGTLALKADIMIPGAPPPPQADNLAIHVLRGASTTVELRGHYSGTGAMTFWIVSTPDHGKLSELRPLGDNRASITYAQDGDVSFLADRFTYLVQAGGRVSAQAEVRITIDEPPAQLRVPDHLDFGEIPAGGSGTRSLMIQNTGGGQLQGRLTSSDPWTVDASTYQVAAGQTQTVNVTFQPNEPKKYVGQVTLTDPAGVETAVQLSGSATAPLRIAPNPLSLGNARRATVFLTNLTDQELILNFRTGTQFASIPTMDLAPKQDADFTVELAPDARPPLSDTITIVGARFSLPLRVEASGVEATPTPTPSAPSATIAPATPPPATTAAPITAPAAASSQPAATEAPAANPAAIVTAQRLAPARWELSWPAAEDARASYHLEERQLALDGEKQLQISWKEIAPATIATTNGKVRAELNGLEAQTPHILRVRALSASGDELWISPLVTLRATPRVSHLHAYWLWLLFGALVVIVILRWRANRTSV